MNEQDFERRVAKLEQAVHRLHLKAGEPSPYEYPDAPVVSGAALTAPTRSPQIVDGKPAERADTDNWPGARRGGYTPTRVRIRLFCDLGQGDLAVPDPRRPAHADQQHHQQHRQEAEWHGLGRRR